MDKWKRFYGVCCCSLSPDTTFILTTELRTYMIYFSHLKHTYIVIKSSYKKSYVYGKNARTNSKVINHKDNEKIERESGVGCVVGFGGGVCRRVVLIT